jgi:prepilin-type N-terminal cleavage/methylation domain-containing protein
MELTFKSIHPKHQQGVTLIELMIAVALMAIILAVGVPNFRAQIEKRQLIGLAEQISAHITLTRSQAITRSAPTYIKFAAGNNWGYGFSTTSDCDVNATAVTIANACIMVIEDGDADIDPGDGSVDAGDLVLNRHDVSEHTGTSLAIANFSDANSQIWFDPVRGISDSGEITVSSVAGNFQLKIKVGLLGDVRICAPGGNFSYSSANC